MHSSDFEEPKNNLSVPFSTYRTVKEGASIKYAWVMFGSVELSMIPFGSGIKKISD